MDFNFSEEQLALRDLALQICRDYQDMEQQDPAKFWSSLAETGLLGVGVGEAHGGLGMGVMGTALVLEAFGHCLVQVPLEETLVASLILGRGATSEQLGALLPDVLAGTTSLSTAMEEWVGNNPSASSILSVPEGGGLRLSGSKPSVPRTEEPHRIVVPVRRGGELTMVLVDPAAPGVTFSSNETTSQHQHADLHLEGVLIPADDVLPVRSTEVATAVAIARVLSAAVVLGACERAIEITVEHGNTREQFGKPLAHNQGYSQRLADASISIDCQRATIMQAAWMLDQGLDASEEVLVASWWASDGGSQVVHATQHLHGGTGADISYPAHRYYLAVKQRANTLGSASSHLAQLGAMITA